MEQRWDKHIESVVREKYMHTSYKEDTIGNRHTMLATWLHSKFFSFYPINTAMKNIH